jgi:hypothetical protein
MAWADGESVVVMVCAGRLLGRDLGVVVEQAQKDEWDGLVCHNVVLVRLHRGFRLVQRIAE